MGNVLSKRDGGGGGDARREACGRVDDEAARTATEERSVQRDEAFRLAGGHALRGAMALLIGCTVARFLFLFWARSLCAGKALLCSSPVRGRVYARAMTSARFIYSSSRTSCLSAPPGCFHTSVVDDFG